MSWWYETTEEERMEFDKVERKENCTDQEELKLINPSVCDDRFEKIAEARKRIIDATNIEHSPDEMKVLDTFLFRCWQMGWLDRVEVEHSEPKTKWHYPSKGELPTEDGKYFCNVQSEYGDWSHEWYEVIEWTGKDWILNDLERIIAWQYIIPPKEEACLMRQARCSGTT